MTTLIAVYSSDGCEGRCDARCYEAEGDVCVCLCQGVNHSAGRQRAEANVREYAATWLEQWTAAHPETVRADVTQQYSLPFLED